MRQMELLMLCSLLCFNEIIGSNDWDLKSDSKTAIFSSNPFQSNRIRCVKRPLEISHHSKPIFIQEIQNSNPIRVSERGLAGSIVSELGVQCDTGERTLELLRGIRLHASQLLKGMSEGDLSKAQLGLGHSYSRSKVKFNVNRSDNMIIQAIALLDVLDKDVNTFSMRVREWYGWHFPELVKLINDNLVYSKLVVFIKNKERLTEEDLDELTELLDGDENNAKNILDASRASMGTEIGDQDMLNIGHFAERVVQLAEYRKSMHKYLVEKMHLVALT